ncbi:MAG: metallophosphoesterase [Bryobacterales bacterium]|nr:metallophosphoesterase [Bryobacterales bacterium]
MLPKLFECLRLPRLAAKAARLFLAVCLTAFLLLGLSGCIGRISQANRTLPFDPKSVTIQPATQGLRVLVIGDFGTGGKGQRDVAKAIAALHKSKPFSFGITVGDNFYEHGVSSVTDRKWQTRWEEPYGSLGIPFYPTLGNHDYYGDVQSQLDYKSPSDSWHLPARQYTLRSALVDFVALDTTDPRTEQYAWLDRVLSESSAHWKIVYGHHPIYSAGYHGDVSAMERELLPVIRGRAALYVAGHDHDLQYLKPVDGTHLIVSGGGGGRLRQLRPDPRTLFARTMYGFTTLDIDPSRIRVEMFDQNGQRVFESEIFQEPSRTGREQPAEAEPVAR